MSTMPPAAMSSERNRCSSVFNPVKFEWVANNIWIEFREFLYEYTSTANIERA